MSTLKSISWLCFFSFIILLFFQCETTSSSNEEFLNLKEDVKYVGMHVCQSCHTEVHQSFIHTGMGRSFDHATLGKTDATFGDHALVYDSLSNFYYFPFFKDSVMFVQEFRLEGKDTIHQRTEKIDYIIGSGQHTNSHILDFNGYVFQAPITFYTQEKKWDMAPGFEGDNLRFSRLLATECITCHNHLPKFAAGSLHKYEAMPRGIECERCHGPGEIHVKEKLAGNIIDTSKFVDYSIVNPRHLSRDLQMDLCQRCHLQGVAVLNEGKTFFDFKPGMELKEVLNVFLPRYTNSHEKFIMASQADRLRLSECFKQSDLSCITCHNPHESVEVTEKEQFNIACLNCHSNDSENEICSASLELRNAEQNNCVVCHMPRAGSIDIPHVNITDHFISKSNVKGIKKQAQAIQENPQFLGLKILSKEKATPLEMAKGYIALYDKYVRAEIMLDSAKHYLDLSTFPLEKKFKTTIHYHFAKMDYLSIIKIVPQIPIEKIQDAWTGYRIGEAYYKNQDYQKALLYYQKAVAFMPLHLDFQEKLGTTYFVLQQFPEAQKAFEFVLSENEKRPVALSNLGYLYVLQGNVDKGEKLYNQAIALDPDYEQVLLNKAAVLLLKKENEAAKEFLKRVLKINPQNQQAIAVMQKL